MTTSAQSNLSVQGVRAKFDGAVIAPGDESYDETRTVFNGGVDRRPAAIIQPRSAAEAARVVALARETGVELAVRSGGHSGLGHGVTEGGLVLDMRRLTELDIDVPGRVARAGGGLTAGAYTAAAAEHGLATGFGDTGSVGIGGLTLGGGIGFLVRKHGLTIDNLLAAEVVTADGEILQVDADNHPDLFWAIRGGGGNFGAVTQFTFRLHELPSVVGGMLLLPASPDAIVSFVEAAQAAPRELSTIANVMPAPPMPFVPEEWHGKLVVMGLLAYAGPDEAGAKALAPFRELAEPVADMVRPISYAEMFPPDPEGYRPIATGRTFFTDSVDHAAATRILDQLEASTAMMRVVQLRALGGAMADVPSDATAFAHRDARVMGVAAALGTTVEEAASFEPWVEELSRSLRNGNEGIYVNFLSHNDPAQVRAAYPGSTYDRLVEVKRRYDPDNLFHLNHNIRPS